MSNAIWLVALPLLGAFLLPLIYRRHTVIGYWAAPLILFINLVIALILLGSDGVQLIEMGGFAPPVGIVFYVDNLALLFVIMIVFGTLILWLGKERGRVREETLLLLLVGGGCGLALSGDLFNIYVFYEIVAVASYSLAASRGTGAGYAASLRFLILGALGSSLLLLGIALIYAVTGTLNLAHIAELAPEKLNGSIGLAAFVLMLIGFGVKAELFPVNTWVAEVYATAPARITALLGGIVSKLAMLIILRLIVLMYGDAPSAMMLLLSLGVLGVVTGELAALRATDLRQVLAFSSIGQLGLVAIAFSIPGQAGIIAGVAIALHHAIVKPALFMLTEAWGGQVSRLVGAVQSSKLSVFLFVIMALSLIGVPPFPGFWAKFLLVTAALKSDIGQYQMAIAVVLIATVIETAYFFKIIRLMFQQKSSSLKAPSFADLAPALSFMVLLFLGLFMLGSLSNGLTSVAEDGANRQAYIENSGR